jgi:hypothetical protein
MVPLPYVFLRVAGLAGTLLLTACTFVAPYDGPARAVVNGLTYDLAVARSLDLSSEELSPYRRVTSIQADFRYLDDVAYSIDRIEPASALVMRLAPGQRDDQPLGDYLLLIRGPDAWVDLCPYFDVTSPATPDVCR